MQSLLYSTWSELELVSSEDPSPFSDEVLVRVAACGICGSELETFRTQSRRRTPPLIMGHEFCGIVASEDGTRFPLGTRVVANAIVHCGECEACQRQATHLCKNREIFGMHRPGAFSEFVAVPERCLLEWPVTIPAAWAALAEPLANGVHVWRLSRTRANGAVLIFGAGPIGLMCALAIRELAGSPVAIADLDGRRLEVARQMGVDVTLDANLAHWNRTAATWAGDAGFETVIDAVGSTATKQQSIEMAAVESPVIWIGLTDDEVTVPSYPITLNELNVIGSYGASMADLKSALELMKRPSVDLDPMIRTYPLSDGVKAFRRQLDEDSRDVKAVLLPT